MPLVILGQRGAAADAARAEVATVHVETELTWNDVRAATARAFVALRLTEDTAFARAEEATVVGKLEAAVRGRIEVGSAPEVEGLRVRAERLRADADAREAAQRVAGAASELGRWLGEPEGRGLRAEGVAPIPQAPPSADLLARVGAAPAVRREEADVRAAESASRASARSCVRRSLSTSPPKWAIPRIPRRTTAAEISIETPLFNQRGPYIERETQAANAARARTVAERARTTADLVVAYRAFEATSARMQALAEGVLPAAEAAANATEESYALGHSPLIAVLDASARGSTRGSRSSRPGRPARSRG